MQETLEKIIQALEKLKKIEDLENTIQWISDYAKELSMIVRKISVAFRFEYDSTTKCVRIYGVETGYEYDMICGEEIAKMGIEELANKALNNQEYVKKALENIAVYLKDLVELIEYAMSEHEQDP